MNGSSVSFLLFAAALFLPALSSPARDYPVYDEGFDAAGSWSGDARMYVDTPGSRLYWNTDASARAAWDSCGLTTRAGDILEWTYRYLGGGDSDINTR